MKWKTYAKIYNFFPSKKLLLNTHTRTYTTVFIFDFAVIINILFFWSRQLLAAQFEWINMHSRYHPSVLVLLTHFDLFNDFPQLFLQRSEIRKIRCTNFEIWSTMQRVFKFNSTVRLMELHFITNGTCVK